MKIQNAAEFLMDYDYKFTLPQTVLKTVNKIVKDVRSKGDEAVLSYTLKFDKARLKTIKATENEIKSAVKKIEPASKRNIKKIIENIEYFHLTQKEESYVITRGNVILGSKVTPVESAGIYVPGGTAPLISTAVMTAAPAKIAGVKNIYAATPPDKKGKINPYILYTLKLLGVKEIYKMGGAQAVAAMAYGTKSVKKAVKIAGPGNIYVAAAKKIIYPDADIDMIAGPSEILVATDSKTNIKYAAADILSQAEHDKLSRVFLVSKCKIAAEKIIKEVKRKARTSPRADILKHSLKNNFFVINVKTSAQAAEVINKIAPEHVELLNEDAALLAKKITNAGAIFLGEYSAEALGDYAAGPNHTLPTAGTAKFYSPLSPASFQKKTSIINYTRYDKKDSELALYLAQKEGLFHHYDSVSLREKGKN